MIRKSVFVYYFCFISTLYICHARVVNGCDLKLELVQLVFRHGARTPLQGDLNVFSYYNTSVFESWGLGVLTTRGKQQEYEFGSLLRERYDGFLKADYSPEEVYAYSTNNDRTKMTLQLILAGLYPPIDSKVWNQQLKWSPIPYFTMPSPLDILIKNHDGPRYLKLVEDIQNTDEFKARFAKHSEFLNFLTNKTGVAFDKKIKNIQYMYGTLDAIEHMNLKLPEWYTPDVKQKFIKVMEIIFDSYTYTVQTKKAYAGLLIRTFIENMNLNKIYSNPRKIYLYSGHDSTVTAFFSSHKIQEFRYTNYGDGLILEKFRDSQDKVYVRLLAWLSEKKKFKVLQLGSHKEFCPIEDYLKLVKPVLPTDQEIDQMLAEVDIKQLKDAFFKDPLVKDVN